MKQIGPSILPARLSQLIAKGIVFTLIGFLGPRSPLFAASEPTSKSDEATALAKAQKEVEANPENAEARLSLSRLLMAQGNADAALVEIRKAIEIAPEKPYYYYALGQVLRAMGRFDEVISAAKKCIELDGGEPKYHLLLGVAFASSNLDNEALTVFEKAVSLAPANPDAQRAVGVQFAKMGKFEEAYPKLKKAVELDPKNMASLNALAACQFELGKQQDAIASFREAAKLDLADPLPTINLAKILLKMNKPGHAVAAFCKALSIRDELEVKQGLKLAMESLAEGEAGMKDLQDGSKIYKGDADTLKNIASILTLSGKPTWSTEYWERAIELKPEMAEAHYALGAILGKSGQIDKVFKHLEQATKLNPKYQQAFFALGSMQVEQGRAEAAIENLTKATELNPDDAAAYRNLGTALFAAKQFKSAIFASSKSIELEPGDASPRIILGRSLTALGKRSEAETALLKAIEISPDSSDAYLYLGNELLEQERGLEASKAYLKFLELKPNCAPGFFGLAQAAKLEGQHEKAIAHLKDAVVADPEEMTKRNLLGNWLNSAKRYEEAIEAYRTAIQLRPDEAANYVGLATSLQESNQLPASIEALRKAISLNPHYEGAHAVLGKILSETGENDAEALAAFREGLKLNPKDVKVHIVLGIHFMNLDKLTEARDTLLDALKIAPNSKEVYLGLATVHQEAGELEAALSALTKANTLDGDAKSYVAETKMLQKQVQLQNEFLQKLTSDQQAGKTLQRTSYEEDLTKIYQCEATKFKSRQVREYWEAHRDSLAKEFEHAVVQSITIPKKVDAAKNDTLLPSKLADEIREQALAGKDFSELAKKYSRDTAAETGGRREFDYGSFLPGLRNAVFSLKPDEVSPVLDFDDSYYLFKMIERQTVDPKSIKSDDPKLQAIVSAILETEKQQRWKAHYFQRCLERIKSATK